MLVEIIYSFFDISPNKLRNNYVFSSSFLVTKKCNKKWPFYNVIFIRNFNVPNYNVILTYSKRVTTSNK